MEVEFIGTLQYPERLFVAGVGRQNNNPNAKPRFGCMALIEPDWGAYVEGQVNQLMAQEFPGYTVPSSLRRGAEKAQQKPAAGYRMDNYFVNMSAAANQPPGVFSQSRQVMGPQDPEANLFYPGAVCKFIVDFWAQKQQPGGEPRQPRINCQILGLQFMQHGPVLEGGNFTQPAGAERFGLPSMPGVDPSGAPPAQPVYGAAYGTGPGQGYTAPATPAMPAPQPPGAAPTPAPAMPPQAHPPMPAPGAPQPPQAAPAPAPAPMPPAQPAPAAPAAPQPPGTVAPPAPPAPMYQPQPAAPPQPAPAPSTAAPPAPPANYPPAPVPPGR